MTWCKAKRAHAVAALLLVVALGGMSAPSAAKPSQKEAMAACRAQYGKKVVNAIVQKDGSVRCEWVDRREMTRQEAFDACRKKYGATTILLTKKKDGWLCRYYGRY